MTTIEMKAELERLMESVERHQNYMSRAGLGAAYAEIHRLNVLLRYPVGTRVAYSSVGRIGVERGCVDFAGTIAAVGEETLTATVLTDHGREYVSVGSLARVSEDGRVAE